MFILGPFPSNVASSPSFFVFPGLFFFILGWGTIYSQRLWPKPKLGMCFSRYNLGIFHHFFLSLSQKSLLRNNTSHIAYSEELLRDKMAAVSNNMAATTKQISGMQIGKLRAELGSLLSLTLKSELKTFSWECLVQLQLLIWQSLACLHRGTTEFNVAWDSSLKHSNKNELSNTRHCKIRNRAHFESVA